MFSREARRLASFASRNRLPMVAPYTRIAEAGALVAYEPDIRFPFRRAAIYVDRILKGATPATLPVAECTRFRLVVNLKAARALGVRVPKAVLSRADQIID
jgi:putative tryptophan/tyrosine transport system substrate-binding protein